MRLSQKLNDNLKFSAYCFYMKTKITLNFRICISVPLRRGGSVDSRLTAKLPLSVPKPNCRRSLKKYT